MTPAETPTKCAELTWGKVSLPVHHADLHAEIESLKESAFLASKRAVKAETIVADLAWFYRVIQAGTEVAHVERGSKLNLSPSEVAGLRRALESIAEKDARIRELVGAIRRETADHKPSVATGLPCKCFICAAPARSEGGSK